MIANINDEKKIFGYTYVMADGLPLRDPYTTIHYYYPIEELFDAVNQLTSYIGKHRKNESGNNRLDELALTEDEMPIFENYCREASDEVYKKIMPYMNHDILSYIYDDEVSDNVEFINSVHYIINKPKWVTENSVAITDKLIKDSIVAYIVHKWFLIVNPEEASFYLADFNDKTLKLKISLGEHQRMSVTSHPF